MNLLRQAMVLALLAFVVGGCSLTYHGIEPMSPAPSRAGMWAQGHIYSPSVDSLTPTFQWVRSEDSSASYDFTIFTAVVDKGGGRHLFLGVHEDETMPGDQVYYQPGLTITTHRVMTPLKPKTRYFWSVRTRHGEQVTPWATFTWKVGLRTLMDYPFVEGGTFRERLFPFITPAE